MADYVRFDIYLPVVYTVEATNKATGRVEYKKRGLSSRQIGRFINECTQRYRGITQSHPDSPVPYKGWWREDATSPSEIDHVTYLFLLVRIDQVEEVKEFLLEWRKKLARSTKQSVILVTYYPLKAIGQFF